MIEIKDLLSKFEDILLNEGLKVQYIREAIFNNTGIKIDKENVKIQNNTIYLNIKPIYKNEIFLNKKKISKSIQEALGDKSQKSIL